MAKRLGPSSSILRRVLPSLSITGPTVFPLCEFCQYAKSRKLSFSSSDIVSTFPLERVHCDVWGPSPILSICGFKYYVVYIDDFFKYLWLFPLRCKSDVSSVFSKLKTQIENLLSFTIKKFRTDGGGEFMNSNFKRLFQNSGIVHHVFLSLYTWTKWLHWAQAQTHCRNRSFSIV